MTSRDVRHQTVSGGALGGLLGSSIRLFVLNHISMGWGPPELKVNAIGLQSTQCLSGPACQGTNALEALESLKSGLGVQYDDEAAESS